MKVYGNILSVLHTDASSVCCSFQFGQRVRKDMENYINLTVRFDRGDRVASICGYPQTWLLHDEDLNEYSDEYLSGKQWLEETGELPTHYERFVSEEHEVEFLEGVIHGIQRQARTKMFKDDCSREYRLKVIRLIRNKIKQLRGAK